MSITFCTNDVLPRADSCTTQQLLNHFNGLDWSLLVKHLVIEDMHNSWLNCFTNPLELGTRCESKTRVPSSKGFVKQFNQELCISSVMKCFWLLQFIYFQTSNCGNDLWTSLKPPMKFWKVCWKILCEFWYFWGKNKCKKAREQSDNITRYQGK